MGAQTAVTRSRWASWRKGRARAGLVGDEGISHARLPGERVPGATQAEGAQGSVGGRCSWYGVSRGKAVEEAGYDRTFWAIAKTLAFIPEDGLSASRHACLMLRTD